PSLTSCSRSAPILKLGISAPRWVRVSRRPCWIGGGTCGGDGGLASCRFLTRHGATMPGSHAIRGSSTSCCRCCVGRSTNSSSRQLKKNRLQPEEEYSTK